jgi:hypothetical protein
MDRSSWVGGNSDSRLEHSCMHQRPQRPRRERRRMGMHHEGEKATGRQSLVVQSRIRLLCLPFLYFPFLPSGRDDVAWIKPRLLLACWLLRSPGTLFGSTALGNEVEGDSVSVQVAQSIMIDGSYCCLHHRRPLPLLC